METLFLSYSRADADAVAPVVAALGALGVTVFQDTSDIKEFDPVHGRIDDGLARSAALLAWYSASYAGRPYCQWELTAAWLTGEAEGDPGRRVLAVNPETGADHIHPTALRDHALATPADPEALARRIKAHLATLPGPLGAVRAGQGGLWAGVKPPARRHFVGRRPQLWAIHDGLAPGTVAVISAAANPAGPGQVRVEGLGGIGKTMLAEEYALRFERAHPGGVFWLSASDGGGRRPAAFETHLLGQLERLGRDVAPAGETVGQPQDRVIARLLDTLRGEDRPYLWVIDDWPHGADDGALEAWRAPTAAGRTLITTRERGISGAGAVLDLDRLEPGEALALLAGHRVPATADEGAAAATLAERLGGHPLALAVAGAAIRNHGYRWFLGVLDRSPVRALTLAAGLRQALPTGHQRDIVATLAWSLERLDEPGRDLLRLAAQLAPEPIPNHLLAACFAEADGHELEDAELAMVAAVDAVASRSLLTAGDGVITVHVLVGLALDALHPAPERAATLRAAAVTALRAAFANLAPDIREHGALHPLAPHARHLTAGAGDEPGLSLLGWLARYDLERAAYPAAAAGLRRQRQGRESLLGPEHPATLTAMGNLAATLWAQGDHAGARALERSPIRLHSRNF